MIIFGLLSASLVAL